MKANKGTILSYLTDSENYIVFECSLVRQDVDFYLTSVFEGDLRLSDYCVDWHEFIVAPTCPCHSLPEANEQLLALAHLFPAMDTRRYMLVNNEISFGYLTFEKVIASLAIYETEHHVSWRCHVEDSCFVELSSLALESCHHKIIPLATKQVVEFKQTLCIRFYPHPKIAREVFETGNSICMITRQKYRQITGEFFQPFRAKGRVINFPK